MIVRRVWAATVLLLSISNLPANAAEAIRDKPYDVESGIMEVTRTTKNAAMNMKAVETVYFKNWGRTEVRHITETTNSKYTKGEQVSRKISLREGTTLTTVDLDAKTGTRFSSGMAEAIGGMSTGQATELANQMAKAMNTTVKPAGTATVAGMPCNVTESITAMGPMKMTTRLCLWKNIKLKSETTGAGSEMREEATSVKTGVPIPPDKFKLPADIPITEMRAP